jgi:DNA polymerase I-like protein with 3'-5' exonuclease and polymerase domains
MKKVEYPLRDLTLTGINLTEVPDFCWRGNQVSPRLIVVTESPTRSEIRAGQGYVSDAAHLLEKVLAEAGLYESDVFFYHLNTDPRYDESGKLLPPTIEELFVYAAKFHEIVLSLIPKHILMLGNGAVSTLLGRDSASSSAGATLEYIFPYLLQKACEEGNSDPWLAGRSVESLPSIVVSTDLHPSVFFTNERDLPVWQYRITKLVENLGHKVELAPTDVVLLDTFDRARNFLTAWLDEPLDTLVYDWETCDLNPCTHKETITRTIGFARDATTGYCIPTWHKDNAWGFEKQVQICSLIGKLLRKPRRATCGLNLLFDNLVSRCDPWLDMGQDKLPGIREEVMYLAYVNDETGPQGLKELSNVYTDLNCYDDELEAWIKGDPAVKTNYGLIPFNILGRYNALDVIATFRLRNALVKKISEDDRGPFLDIAFKLMNIEGQALEDMAFHGQKIDRDILFKEGKYHEHNLREAMFKLMNAPEMKDFISKRRVKKAVEYAQEKICQPINLLKEYTNLYPTLDFDRKEMRKRITSFTSMLLNESAKIDHEGNIIGRLGELHPEAKLAKELYASILIRKYDELNPDNDDLTKWKPWLKDEEYQADEEELIYYAKNAGQGYKPNFNTSGGGEMGDFFFDFLKVPISVRSEKTGKPSLAKEARPQLIGAHPLITDFFKYKDTVKEYGTYFKPLIKGVRLLEQGLDSPEIDKNYCSHLEIRLGKVVTGRTSAQRIQTFPRKGKVKNMYVSRFHHGLIVQGDMGQAELRVIASLANEPKMIEAYLAGEDLHKTTSALLFGKDFTECTDPKFKKEMRAGAKRINFGTVYGIGAQGIVRTCKQEGVELLRVGGYNVEQVYELVADRMGIQRNDPYAYGELEFAVDQIRVEIAEEVLKKFYNAYPDLTIWVDKVHNFIEENAYYFSPFGRIRRLPGIRSENREDQGDALRQGQNFPVQSAASDIALIALAATDWEIKECKILALSIAAIHDSLIYDSPLEQAVKVAEILKRRLCTVEENVRMLIPEFSTSWLKVPLAADISIGPSWGVDYPYVGDGKIKVQDVENGDPEDLIIEVIKFWDWYDARSN